MSCSTTCVGSSTTDPNIPEGTIEIDEVSSNYIIISITNGSGKRIRVFRPNDNSTFELSITNQEASAGRKTIGGLVVNTAYIFKLINSQDIEESSVGATTLTQVNPPSGTISIDGVTHNSVTLSITNGSGKSIRVFRPNDNTSFVVSITNQEASTGSKTIGGLVSNTAYIFKLISSMGDEECSIGATTLTQGTNPDDPGDTLELGDTGSEVTALQQDLVYIGYTLSVTGTFNAATESAVRVFQTLAGIGVDGIVGQETSNKLAAVVSNKNNGWLSRGMIGLDVQQLQNDLFTLGYSCGGADGEFGIGTYNAVFSFQTVQGIVIDGIVKSATMDIIIAALTAQASNITVIDVTQFTITLSITNGIGKKIEYFIIPNSNDKESESITAQEASDGTKIIDGLIQNETYLFTIVNIHGLPESSDSGTTLPHGTGNLNIDSWTDSDVYTAKTSLFLLGYKNIAADASKEDNFKKDLVDFMKGYGKKDEFFSSNQDKTKLLEWLGKASNGTMQPLSIYDATVISAKKNLGELGYKNLFLFDEHSDFISAEFINDLLDFANTYGLTDRYAAINYDKPSIYGWLQQAINKDLDRVIKNYTIWGEVIKSNGQVQFVRTDGTEVFSNYGGIANTDAFLQAVWGNNYTLSSEKTISGISNVTQNVLESNAGNCTLTAITKILKYFGDHCGYTDIPPSLKDIYDVVRDIGIQNGYDPNGSGIWYDLVTFGSYKIDNMIRQAWSAFGYPTGNGSNSFPNIYTFDDIRSNVDNSSPLLLSMTNGDYSGHTVTVVGYKEYMNNDGLCAQYIKIYDNWSDEYRYIDWTLFGMTCYFSVLTSFIPPAL